MSKPLCIDLFCGLGGWTEGFLAEGWDVVGFDIERHQYWFPEESPDNGDGAKNTKPVAKRGWTQGCAVALGMEGAKARPRTRLVQYPAQLVFQDVLTIHGSQFRNADCIVASPPCQKYSWLAMPWSRSKSDHSKAAKALRREWEANGPDNRLFDACFRIQREACEAAGRFIPLVVENVRGAQEWVGRAAWSYGSFYLWGDVPGLMPFSGKQFKGKTNFHFYEKTGLPSPSWHGADHEPSVARAIAINRTVDTGLKIGGDWFSDPNSRKHGSRSKARKAASAQIAKIPLPLSQHIARVYYPRDRERVA